MDKNMMTHCPARMREVFTFLLLIAASPALAQEDCDNIVTIPELAAQIQELLDAEATVEVDTIIMVSEGSYEVHLSNGTTFTQIQGCTDSAYYDYNAEANTDDGSCTNPAVCMPVEFDGYTYSVVEVGRQCWFAENLQTTVYANGSGISNVTSYYQWGNPVIGGARCDYHNDLANVTTYGRLYNWYAVDDARGLCPTGWHVPTHVEWTELGDYIISQGFAGAAGTALKSTTGWNNGGNGTDDFGFSALPGGFRSENGPFGDKGLFGFWWSSSLNGYSSYHRWLGSDEPIFYWWIAHPRQGHSVRCLRDSLTPEIQGCTNPAYIEYIAAANIDDGSCANAVVSGCTDPAYTEYDASANSDDGSCASLVDLNCLEPTMDGYDYDVAQVGDQCWFTENLRTTIYADGTAILEVADGGAWIGLSTGARCDYNNDSANVTTYGRLYNWYSVDDARGLCPEGWHVPTDEEWTQLEDYITLQGFAGTEGMALKSTTGWNFGGNGTDDFGLSAFPGGSRASVDGGFSGAGDNGAWWSSSSNGGDAWCRFLFSDSFIPQVIRGSFPSLSGFSVRCLRNVD